MTITTTTTRAFVAGSAALLATLCTAPAMARDPWDRAHGFGLDDPYTRASVDQCAAAAESRAAPARVVRITNVDRQRGGFLVSGELRVENRWGRHGGDRRGWFKCHTRMGRVVDLRLN